MKNLDLVLVFIFGLLMSIVLGLAAATASKPLIAFASALPFLILVLALPVKWLIYGLILLTLLFAGAVDYLLKVRQLYWIGYGIGLVLYLRLLIHAVSAQGRRLLLAPFMAPLILFFAVAVLATVLASVPPLQAFVTGGKSYLYMWSLVFVLMLMVNGEKTLLNSWKLLLLVALIQWPIVFYQYFFVSAKRVALGASSGADAIVGTFGGSELGGGNSAAMAAFQVIIILGVIAFWRAGRLNKLPAVLMIGLCAIPLIFGEVKGAVLVFLPVGLVMLLRHDILRKPLRFLAMSLVGVVISLAVVGVGYQTLHGDNVQVSHQSTEERLVQLFERTTDPDLLRERTGELGRTALLVFWWRENGWSDMKHSLLGYGMGASRVSTVSVGEIARAYPYALDRHAMSILLWDTGLLGVVAFSATLLLGARLSIKLARDTLIPEPHRILLELGSIALMLFVLSLMYKSFTLNQVGMQVLMSILLGQAGYWYISVRNHRIGPGRLDHNNAFISR